MRYLWKRVCSNLKTHIVVDTGEIYYKCDACDKGFAMIGRQKAHIVIHTGRRLSILLHSERPKLHGVLAFLSAIGLNVGFVKNSLHGLLI